MKISETMRSGIMAILADSGLDFAKSMLGKVPEAIQKNIQDTGGKKNPADEKWYQYSRRKMDTHKRSVWDYEIHEGAMSSFGSGFFSRIAYLDASTAIRVNLAAMAQEEIPTIKVEIKNDKGEVKKVITRPVTLNKPLSTWFMENCVDEYLAEKQVHINAGKTPEEAATAALSKVTTFMRNAGFAVGRTAGVYQSLDNFVSIFPKSADDIRKTAQLLRDAATGKTRPVQRWLNKTATFLCEAGAVAAETAESGYNRFLEHSDPDNYAERRAARRGIVGMLSRILN